MSKKKNITIICIVIAVVIAASAFLTFHFYNTTYADDVSPLSSVELDADDMNVLGLYMDEDVNEEVSNRLNGSGTPNDWVTTYVEIDPSFNNVLIEQLGVTAK